MLVSDSDDSLDESDDSLSTHYHEAFGALPCLSSQTFPVPHVEMEILKSKYDIPVKVIGFIDTGAAQTMVNPNIFPGIWKDQPNHFAAASGKVFTTSYVSRQPVGIQLFP